MKHFLDPPARWVLCSYRYVVTYISNGNTCLCLMRITQNCFLLYRWHTRAFVCIGICRGISRNVIWLFYASRSLILCLTTSFCLSCTCPRISLRHSRLVNEFLGISLLWKFTGFSFVFFRWGCLSGLRFRIQHHRPTSYSPLVSAPEVSNSLTWTSLLSSPRRGPSSQQL